MAKEKQSAQLTEYGSSCASDADTFHLFPKLPPELRLMIVKRACFIPRNVSLWQREARHYEDDEDLEFSYHSKSSPSEVLHISRGFRTEALRWYTLAFGQVQDADGVVNVLRPKVYINWPIDRLCIMETDCMLSRPRISGHWLLDICRKSKLQNLGINVKCLDLPPRHGTDPRTMISTFIRESKVKDVVLFSTPFYSNHEKFTLEPFQKVNMNGKLPDDVFSPVTLRSMTLVHN